MACDEFLITGIDLHVSPEIEDVILGQIDDMVLTVVNLSAGVSLYFNSAIVTARAKHIL